MEAFKPKTPKEVIEIGMRRAKELESKALLDDALQMFRVLDKLVEGNALSAENANLLSGHLTMSIQTSNEDGDIERVKGGLAYVRNELNGLLWQKCPPKN
jgi:hypothetical protein